MINIVTQIRFSKISKKDIEMQELCSIHTTMKSFLIIVKKMKGVNSEIIITYKRNLVMSQKSLN
jgi:hypothetical protein